MICPITYCARVVDEQPVTCDSVKQPAAPQGPFGATAWAKVSRFSRSSLADQDHPDVELVLVDLCQAVHQRVTLAGVTFADPPKNAA